MSQDADLHTLVKYCRNDKCCDPVSGFGGTRKAKRQLQFAGIAWWTYAKYRCPVCEDTYFFRRSLTGSGDYVPLTHSKYRFEIRVAVTLLIIAALAVVIQRSIDNHSTAKRRQAQQEMQSLARLSTREFIEVKAERAEVYSPTHLRVLVAARIQRGADLKRALFIHAVGYFLDQNGTRYDPYVTSIDDPQEQIDAERPVSVVAGEIYRYYLVASTHADPYSNSTPAKRISKLTVYFPEAPPQEVSIVAQASD